MPSFTVNEGLGFKASPLGRSSPPPKNDHRLGAIRWRDGEHFLSTFREQTHHPTKLGLAPSNQPAMKYGTTRGAAKGDQEGGASFVSRKPQGQAHLAYSAAPPSPSRLVTHGSPAPPAAPKGAVDHRLGSVRWREGAD